MLVFRYSRALDGRVVYYGRDQAELHHADLEDRMELLLWGRILAPVGQFFRWLARCAESVDPLIANMRAHQVRAPILVPRGNPRLYADCAAATGGRCARDTISLVLEVLTRSPTDQLGRVLLLWHELLNLIDTGRYVPRGQAPYPGFCTNAIDVELLDALDTLHALDAEAGRLVPHYETLFVARQTNVPCVCLACNPTEALMEYCLRGARTYHSTLEPWLYSRTFDELRLESLR